MLVKIFLVLCFAALSAFAKNKFLEDCRQSIYGCCSDGKTEAQGHGYKGCGEALCVDLRQDCERVRSDCVLKLTPSGKPDYKLRNEMRRTCARTCGMCSRRPPAQPKCLRSYYGCCWDDSRATGWVKTPGVGCPVCHDRRGSLCRVFRHFCYSKSGPQARKFLRENCKLTCGIC